MTTKMPRRELLAMQLRRRNETRAKMAVDKMGSTHVLHPDNKTQWRDWK